MKPADRSSPLRTLLRLFALATLFSVASANVQSTHWYRMGEGYPPATVGSPLTTLRDSVGTADLTSAALPATASDLTQPTQNTGVPSNRSLLAPAAGFSATGPLLSTDTEEFGFEIWIRPSAITGTRFIAANGTPGVDGWDLSLVEGRITARCGATILTGPRVQLNVWLHVSLVRSAGVTTLYSDYAFASGAFPNVTS
ncbi:MAG: hypothetical protein JWO82_1099, partial [Akkermansiaceae bacterium]|nr:hypothetical protein [Akkermansiaceae bacterium]